jgi:hypothetical protein
MAESGDHHCLLWLCLILDHVGLFHFIVIVFVCFIGSMVLLYFACLVVLVFLFVRGLLAD